MTLFSELGLDRTSMKSIEKMGFEEASPIQSQTIPLALEGKDIIGQAQTGTGKTAAFGIPLMENIDINNENVQGIVIAPTRELAIQVSEELFKLGYGKRARVLAVYGGQDIDRQIRALKKKPHIIVGTPGRLLDHIKRKNIKLGGVHTVVLDEADEMLNMGFIEDIELILSTVPDERQTLLFSATMPDPIRKIAERFMREPVLVRVKAKEMTVDRIEQYYLELKESEKFDTLARLFDIQTPDLAIVFGRTKRRVDELASALNIRGYMAEGIHGDLSQAKRLSVLKKFKDGSIDVLVATDVAARGLDISGVTHVYNFDIPQDPESYVHRIGRTGRAGKHGIAITFVTPRERGQLHAVEHTTKKRMEKLKTPTLTEALEGQQKAVTEKILNTIENEDLTLYLGQAEELLQKHSAADLVAAMLKSMTKEPDQTPIKLTEESPSPMRRNRGGSSSSGNRQRNGRSSSGRKDYGSGSGKRPSTNRKSNGYGNRSTSQKREKTNKI
ncbi:DEAD/DEAH box helicase [Peribacillus frigoritolerans]|uniref:DEAD/DEAH box helicase n=1 Tax=Peribacillus TaxID=2675229 RepID=UPI0005586AF3|nr:MULTISPECIES: DEAD/DEAH box helicase [Peribacillus]KRF54066.1 DEAD/DEAH box helicase [Bacillus sp. Soil745]MBD8138727.1 DEAD/DEAH box helicase [Bacillus sp. CFBP 13597]PAW26419.1 ATP-dependent RNA helicase [Peribacillus simplex]QNK49903.1 DEAD/DEAH box helicase [Brevibacterium sp. PAMC23299]MCP1492015.1 ATP-dependent RNA helicase DeaD [Peribacillus frigoritolerans]